MSVPRSVAIRKPRSPRRRALRSLALILLMALLAAACGSDDTDTAEATDTTEAEVVETTEAADAAEEEAVEAPEEDAEAEEEEAETEASTESAMESTTSVRDSGMTVTVQQTDGPTVHTLTAPEEVFANSTHIIETENSLVLFDTQFLLPNAADFRAYADELGKPIDRVFITHEHPDHFLGSEVFADTSVYALESVSAAIAANGDAEVEEKQGDFGPEAIAGTYIVPEVVEPGTIEIDGVTFELSEVDDAEAEVQLVVRLPDHGVLVAGDLVYSGVHLIMAGPADTWTVALNELAADGDSYPIVLAGHGVPGDQGTIEANVAWLATASELIGTVDNAEDFKQGLVDAYPDLGMPAAIDFVTPFLFPEEG